jgi:hypothetical protein
VRRAIPVLCVFAAAAGVATADVDPHRRMSGAPRSRPVPSEVLFPQQQVPLRFSHATHVGGLSMECVDCHFRAQSSRWATDSLLPAEAVCRDCHAIDRANPEKVSDPPARCDFCHEGFRAGQPVARIRIPRPFVRFPHEKHVTEERIPCERCHGDVRRQDLATRTNLPTMPVCLECHNGSKAPSGCRTCHLAEPDGRLRTRFETGVLVPPRWMRGAEHTPDWTLRHAEVAGADSAFCGSCHAERECLECHEASDRVRNRRVHPNDWLTTHPVSARRDDPRCASCHREQTFCITCHRRAGVVASGPTAGPPGGRFHPPREVWVEVNGGPSSLHHSYQARRNLQACVSCHAENDCLECHALDTFRPGGVNPHPRGIAFLEECGRLLSRNPAPCLACHGARDPLLRQCQ